MTSVALAALLKPVIAPLVVAMVFFPAAAIAWLLRRFLPDGALKRLLLLRVGRSWEKVRKRRPKALQRRRAV